jgi:hypothetical protein
MNEAAEGLETIKLFARWPLHIMYLGLALVVALDKTFEPHGFAAFGISVECVGCLTV